MARIRAERRRRRGPSEAGSSRLAIPTTATEWRKLPFRGLQVRGPGVGRLGTTGHFFAASGGIKRCDKTVGRGHSESPTSPLTVRGS